MNGKVALGVRAKHRFTGFQGVVTARAEYRNGCIRALVCSDDLHEGKPNEVWFDEEDVDILEEAEAPQKAKPPTGGPARESSGMRATDPRR